MLVSEFKKAVELVKPGIAKKEFLEQSSCIVFQNNRIYTFNDEVAVSVPFESGITGAVAAEPLYAFLSRIDAKSEMEIKSDENEFRLSCGRMRAGIRRQPEIKLPMAEEIQEPTEWNELPESFIQAVKSVIFSAAKSGNSPILTCVHFTESFVETCDEFRMTRASYGEIPIEDANVVAANVDKLSIYEPTHFGIAGNWMHFKNKDSVLYCVRIVEGEYPDLDKFTEVEGGQLTFPPEVSDALDWASVIVDSSIKLDQSVDVTLDKKKGIVIRGEGPEGWAEKAIRFKYSGDPISFQIHPTFLKDLASRASIVTLGKRSLKIETDKLIHIVSHSNNEE